MMHAPPSRPKQRAPKRRFVYVVSELSGTAGGYFRVATFSTERLALDYMRDNKWDAINMPSHELHAVELDASQPSPFRPVPA